MRAATLAVWVGFVDGFCGGAGGFCVVCCCGGVVGFLWLGFAWCA